jgi:hypothetical protein
MYGLGTLSCTRPLQRFVMRPVNRMSLELVEYIELA